MPIPFPHPGATSKNGNDFQINDVVQVTPQGVKPGSLPQGSLWIVKDTNSAILKIVPKDRPTPTSWFSYYAWRFELVKRPTSLIEEESTQQQSQPPVKRWMSCDGKKTIWDMI